MNRKRTPHSTFTRAGILLAVLAKVFLASAPLLSTLSHAGSANDGAHSMQQAIRIGDLEIDAPYARATLPGAPVSGGYLKIRNTGAESDRLLGGTATFAGAVEVHEMAMDGEVMKMREISGGLEIPAGGEVVLEPGAVHLMFMHITEQLNEGEIRKVTLQFEKAGAVEIDFAVKQVERGGHGAMDHSGHGKSN